jgi:hypothetical protein
MAADRATHATPFATNEAWRRCPALFRRNLWHLQVVDMAVVSGKRAVVVAETLGSAKAFAAFGID